LLADGDGMTEQHQDQDALCHPAESDEDVVAASAARILSKADRAVTEIRAEAERAAAQVRRTAAADSGAVADPDRATEDLRVEVEAERRDDRAAMADFSSDLESVHADLDPIKAGIIGLQNHSLRQTGVTALILAVLLAIAWKVIAG
jgi:peptidoglycan hydrolase CwlO-like protein